MHSNVSKLNLRCGQLLGGQDYLILLVKQLFVNVILSIR